MKNDSQTSISAAIVYPSHALALDEAQKQERLSALEALGFNLTDLAPQISSSDGYTAGPSMERALQLSRALTKREYSVVFAARGGSGTTALIPHLEACLPPILDDKKLVGFSDISFLGVYLALRYPTLTYIHGEMPLTQKGFLNPSADVKLLVDLLHGQDYEHCEEGCFGVFPKNSAKTTTLTGPCVPLNLTLAQSLCGISHVELPQNNILFLEDCNEPLYRILRKFDSLVLAGFLKNTQAIVIGEMDECHDVARRPLDLNNFCTLLGETLGLPVVCAPIFGHSQRRFPLVFESPVTIQKTKDNLYDVFLTSKKLSSLGVLSRQTTDFPINLYQSNLYAPTRVHFTGIGGSGMAPVAGLLVQDGDVVSGSDTPIYPPMDKLIADLGITPDVGFAQENILKHDPQAIVCGNIISRVSASLHKNEELEYLLTKKIPIYSFPSMLRRKFLHKSFNVVMSGTHGKTTTSTLMAYLLAEFGLDPSYLIGGRPVNLPSGFALKNKDLFVLEGDEYDSAFFDKGPKFLHYEPAVTLINNIEFDHADIYPHVEAIEAEFLRLACLTRDHNGVVVANLEDSRVVGVVEKSQAKVIGFARSGQAKTSAYPCWVLEKTVVNKNGTLVSAKDPSGENVHFQMGLFGEHNALNALGVLGCLTVTLEKFQQGKSQGEILSVLQTVLPHFRGVKRRFEKLTQRQGIAVFDDFAHHPTAIASTLKAFRGYLTDMKKSGRLIACFEPKNATMRRRVMQNDLANSFQEADLVLIGKLPEDLRTPVEERFHVSDFVQSCPVLTQTFDTNENLLAYLQENIKINDTVVFMTSGSFDGVPAKLAAWVNETFPENVSTTG